MIAGASRNRMPQRRTRMSKGRASMNQCRNALGLFLVVTITVCVLAVGAPKGGQAAPSGAHRAQPNSVRLYVFDCGTLHIEDMTRFQLKREEVATTDLAVA